MQNSLVPSDLSIFLAALVIFQSSTRVSGTFPLVIKTVASKLLSAISRKENIYIDSTKDDAAGGNGEYKVSI